MFKEKAFHCLAKGSLSIMCEIDIILQFVYIKYDHQLILHNNVSF